MRTEFVGRQEELAWLRSQFDACATRGTDGQYGGPRMAFVIAESGVGKSRLVQELYLQLTSNPQWDPPEVEYWPDAFKASGQELHVVPDMKGHEAKGPPRFAWLGGRWHPTNERNVQARKSILPELRSSLTVHAEILRAHQSLWQDAAGRILGAVQQEGAGELIGQLADNALPFGGLLLKVASSIKDFAAERRAGPKSYEDVSQKQALTDVDEVLDCFRLLLNAKSAVPAVLWLDDAQWIDADTLLFVKRLWQEATRQRWPLLLVVTHWEREWRELAHAEDGKSLHRYSGKVGVAELLLRSPPNSTLRECLKARLPGLTEQQAMLMIEKAAGNFLQLLENIGAISNRSRHFVDRSPQSPLTEEAEAIVRKYETDRERRVTQRFEEFEEDVQDVLGWSSQFGQRFISDVVESFASEQLEHKDAGSILGRCVDPYVVLERPSPLTRAFRDKAFHQVASRHRQAYLLKDADRLSAIMRNHLVEWISNSATADNVILASNTHALPERCVARLTTEERRDLLGFALVELPLPESPDWANSEHKAALWATFLACDNDSRGMLWRRVGAHLDRLRDVRWNEVPLDICAPPWLEVLAENAQTSGRSRVAHGIAEHLLAIAQQELAREETRERIHDLSHYLLLAGDIDESRGQRDAAWERYVQCLELRQRLLVTEETPERLRDVSVALDRIGEIERARGNWDAAISLCKRALAIDQLLLELEETPERLRDVSAILDHIGSIEMGRGSWDAAISWHERALAIDQRLLELGETSDRLSAMSCTRLHIGMADEAHGQMDKALTQYMESLAIAQRSLALEETPIMFSQVSYMLRRIGNIERARGQLNAAMERYQQMLVIAERLLAEEETLQRLRGVIDTLKLLFLVDGDLGRKDGAIQRIMHSFEFGFRLCAASESAEDGYDLIVMLNPLGDVCRDTSFFAAFLEISNKCVEHAKRLEAMCCEEVRFMDACAAFWESRAAATEAVGEFAVAKESSQRAAVLRQRIADLGKDGAHEQG